MEFALLAPWVFFLFAGALDLGFYSYAMIATESASRVAALYTSSSQTSAADATGACQYVLAELKALPNVRNVSSCSALPVQVTVTAGAGADNSEASTVSVTYQTPLLIPIPGVARQVTITRATQMLVREQS
ncbi:MAG TPA: TadE family protein [Bryobacteraceae bacterium]|nr:TadE family protein [Bryobacteraceae bacterium]